jgi:hypothetical protein
MKPAKGKRIFWRLFGKNFLPIFIAILFIEGEILASAAVL